MAIRTWYGAQAAEMLPVLLNNVRLADIEEISAVGNGKVHQIHITMKAAKLDEQPAPPPPLPSTAA